MNDPKQLEHSPLAAPRRRRSVLLVEDHAVVREAIADMLDRSIDWMVCGQAHDGRRALELAETFPPDLILLDFLLAGHDGFDLVRALSSLASSPAVLVLSVLPEPEIGERVIRAGARGFLNKRAEKAALIRAMHDVCAGRLVASDETMLRIASDRLGFPRPTGRPSPVDRLSDREFEVLCLLGGGLALSEIGARLGLSPRTVESHRENIKNKLNLQLASEVSRWARAWWLEYRTGNSTPSSY